MIGMLKQTIALDGLKYLIDTSNEHFNSAMEKGAIQFLTWSNVGSSGTSRKPPIKFGVLRGSSSAFVGSKLVSIFPQDISVGADKGVTPAKSYKGKNDITATFVWNTDYATKMHEWTGAWGPRTLADGDAGDKWLEMHLKADKEALMKMVNIQFRMEVGGGL